MLVDLAPKIDIKDILIADSAVIAGSLILLSLLPRTLLQQRGLPETALPFVVIATALFSISAAIALLAKTDRGLRWSKRFAFAGFGYLALLMAILFILLAFPEWVATLVT